MFALQNSATYKVGPDDPVIVFKNGGFGLNIGNPRVSRNIIANLRKMAKIPVTPEGANKVSRAEPK